MRTLIIILLLAVQAQAQKLTIPTGPVAVGDWVQVDLKEFDMNNIKLCKVHYYPRPAGVKIIPAKTWGDEAIVLFSAKVAGTYLLYTDSPYAECEIVVGGIGPGPGPIPPVPPNPPTPEPPVPPAPQPDTKYQIMLFQDTDQTDNLPIAQVALLSGRNFRQELEKLGHTFVGSYNLSKYKCKTGQCPNLPEAPANLQQWINWLGNTPLPAVILWDGKDGSVPRVFELPKTKEEFLQRLGTKWTISV